MATTYRGWHAHLQLAEQDANNHSTKLHRTVRSFSVPATADCRIGEILIVHQNLCDLLPGVSDKASTYQFLAPVLRSELA